MPIDGNFWHKYMNKTHFNMNQQQQKKEKNVVERKRERVKRKLKEKHQPVFAIQCWTTFCTLISFDAVNAKQRAKHTMWKREAINELCWMMTPLFACAQPFRFVLHCLLKSTADCSCHMNLLRCVMLCYAMLCFAVCMLLSRLWFFNIVRGCVVVLRLERNLIRNPSSISFSCLACTVVIFKVKWKILFDLMPSNIFWAQHFRFPCYFLIYSSVSDWNLTFFCFRMEFLSIVIATNRKLINILTYLRRRSFSSYQQLSAISKWITFQSERFSTTFYSIYLFNSSF